jgi:HD-like signal output (HDOD) protein
LAVSSPTIPIAAAARADGQWRGAWTTHARHRPSEFASIAMELDVNETKLLEKLRAANIRIPPRPQVLHDIEKMLQDDNSTDRMIGQLISRDASLTAEVFKLVNSAFYRRGKKFDSLEQAVRMLGRKSMGTLARSAMLRQQLSGNDPRMEQFWERCVDIGTICSVLCDQLELRAVNREQAYLVGLFHDCGVPVLVRQVTGYGNVALAPGAVADFIAEDDDKGTSHCIAGILVAQQWELPEMLCEAIRAHHYVIADDQPAAHAIAVLQLARHGYARLQNWGDPEWEFHSERALRVLELPLERLDSVLDEALASFEMLH